MRTATEQLQAVIARAPFAGSPFALLRAGMDDFRILNETLGHAVGDQVLAIAEGRLCAAVREHDAVIRLPDDEFAVLLHSTSSVLRAGTAADRLNELLCRVYFMPGQGANITASIGIALAPEDGTYAELLLKRAGIALHCAKNAGTGMVHFFEPAMEEGRRKRPAFSAQLHPAMLLP